MQQLGEGLSGEAEEESRDQFSCGTGGPLGLEVRAEGKVHNEVLCTVCTCMQLRDACSVELLVWLQGQRHLHQGQSLDIMSSVLHLPRSVSHGWFCTCRYVAGVV